MVCGIWAQIGSPYPSSRVRIRRGGPQASVISHKSCASVTTQPLTLPAMTILRFTVTDQDTAIALGSGDVPVLATPRLIAWLEAATVLAAAERLDASSTTVGTEVWLQHRRATPVGASVLVEVTAVEEQDRGLAFEVVARDLTAKAVADVPEGDVPAEGRVIATGRVLRAVVDRGAFLARVGSPAAPAS